MSTDACVQQVVNTATVGKKHTLLQVSVVSDYMGLQMRVLLCAGNNLGFVFDFIYLSNCLNTYFCSMNTTCIRPYADQVLIGECKKKLQKAENSLGRLSQVLTLAGNDVRLKILYLLEEENELCVCDLADVLEMTIPAVSQHLRKLKDGNILQTRRKGQTIYYTLKEEHLEIIKPLFEHITITKRKMQKA